MSTSPKRLASLASAAVVAAGLTVLAPPAQATPAGDALVINEVYGAGGNTGAVYTADFVELYNPTAAPIDLLGTYVAYRSATNGLGGAVALRGTVPAGDTYLVQMSAAGTIGTALPTPDKVASPAINMAAAGGQVLLQEGFGPVAAVGDLAGADGVIDMVGLGSGNGSFEGGTGPAATATQSANRTGGADTDDNSVDLTLAAPTPDACGCVSAPGSFTGTIAQIQGQNTPTSPHLDDTVTTTGVVTALYPTGGFNGFFLQTGGTGGDTDATPGASDGIFVFTPGYDDSALALGDTVAVTGEVSEFGGLTEITVTDADDVDDTVASQPAVTAWDAAYPTSDAGREAHEGELLDPTDTFTVTNSFNTNRFGEIGLATGDKPLLQPTEVALPGSDEADEIVADNAARGVVLDDASTADYTGSASGTALPWLTPPPTAPGAPATTPVRVGAAATIKQPLVLDFRNNTWKFQPQAQVTAVTDDSVATFANTRKAQPAQVGGDLKLATFNVLNYFNTTGSDYNASGLGTCTSFNDRAGNPVAVNTCTPTGPRGAWNAANLKRQQDKIVRAINNMDADIVSLEEIENSVALGEDNRDDAVATLVAALNSAADSTRWAYAPSPAKLPALSEQDVIRTAFIFNPDTVSRVGQSEVLVGSAAFANAREPLAQAFKAEGATDAEAFAVVVNHFKSKGCTDSTGDNVDSGDGQSCYNGDRVEQADALVDFADDFAERRGTSRVFLTGDFNSYTMEDPMQELYDADYDVVESDTANEWSYSFSGLSGSLDHVLANPAAMDMVTGADIWETNANESPGYQYGRFNYNVTNLYAATPYAASDHNPEVVGLDTSVPPPPKTIQILGTNDFHGRILNNPTGAEAGAAVLAGAVKQLRDQNEDTLFAAAGDLIGASTFESFIQHDKPTIDALNEAGLDVSSVGNHEFDQGYDDLVNRVMAPYDVDDNPFGGAQWKYLGANVKFKATGNPALPATWMKKVDGVDVGFVGAVTEHLPELVSPAGIADLEITDIVEAANEEAENLKDEGAEIVILLVHEGAATTSYASATDPASDFGKIVNGVNGDIDAIISGHTHLAYNHRVPVPEWAAQDRPVTKRPVVSSGQYGYNLNRLRFRVDPMTGEVLGIRTSVLALQSNDGAGNWTPNYLPDSATASIVADADAVGKVLGARQLGEIAGPFNRARTSTNAENRGGESTVGNLVAEVQRWATPDFVGGAQIAFMNPGGLRQDMVGGVTAGDPYPRTLTFRQAADVQPFANTLVNMDLTGAQIKATLEQQWQPAGASRPFLRLGASKGFTYTYDATKAAGSRITAMFLNGTPIDLAATYAVTVNSFLAAGGDSFFALAGGTNKQDTGITDLQAMVDYMAEFANTGEGDQPLPVDSSQHAVGVRFPAGAPASYGPGDHVTFDLTSLALSTAADLKDASVTVSLGGTSLGSFPVDNATGTDILDEYGTASVDVTIPAGTPGGATNLVVAGAVTGTSVLVPIVVAGGSTPPPPPPPAPTTTTVAGSADAFAYGTTGTLSITVTPATAEGQVDVLDESGAKLGTATISAGSGTLSLAAAGLKPGVHTLTLKYLGTSKFAASQGTVDVKVKKAKPKVKVKVADSVDKAGGDKVVVRVTAPDGITVRGKVKLVIKGTGKSVTVKLVKGKAVIELPKIGQVGTFTLKAKYLGSALLTRAGKNVKVDVTS
jgi:5'-nucleotidase